MGMKFRKKPVVIDAWLVPHPNERAPMPKSAGFLDAVLSGQVEMVPSGGAIIHTLEGDMRADVGDWIIRGVKGEFYPCKPDVFAATYEPADPLP
jgi:hypothetical protein